MKRCPTCATEYFDDMLEFCLEDGTKLLFVSKLADDAPTVTRQNAPTPFTEKTLNLPFTAAQRLEANSPNDVPTIASKDSALEKETGGNSFKFLEILPVVIALAHNWWQWLYVNNQYISSVTSFLISANFLMWLLLLAAGAATSLFVIRRGQNHGYAFVSLVILSVNLILFLVPKR